MKKKRRRLNMAKVSSNFVGKPYERAGWGGGQGYDCVTFIASMLDRLGLHKVPEGSIFSKEKYIELVELWEKDPEAAIEIAIEYLRDSGADEIEPLRMRPGDIVFFKLKEQEDMCFGMCGGNRHILTTFRDRGISPIKAQHLDIEKVFRCRQE